MGRPFLFASKSNNRETKSLNSDLNKGIEARAELLYPALLEVDSVHGWYGARGMA
jgi:hypothetical protein